MVEDQLRIEERHSRGLAAQVCVSKAQSAKFRRLLQQIQGAMILGVVEVDVQDMRSVFFHDRDFTRRARSL